MTPPTPDISWQDKLAQLFHDPFWKAWCQGRVARELARWLGEALEADVDDAFFDRFAQDRVGMLLSLRMLGDGFAFPGKGRGWSDAKELAEALDTGRWVARLAPDLMATGADRPVLGTASQVRVQLWEPGRDHVVVTHPLARHPLAIPVPPDLAGLKRRLDFSLDRLDDYRRKLEGLTGNDRFRRAALLAWRRLPEDLARDDGVFWPLQPADTRCPDHGIWDHLRMSSALAFVSNSTAADDSTRTRLKTREARPWLLTAWVGPARDFVGLARTGRDLWTGSTLLAELAWAMIEPVAEALGPDAILYPDLRANPRADRWLWERHRDVLDGPPRGSRASLVPNRFVAVVPERLLDTLPEALDAAVRRRWEAMAEAVKAHLRLPNNLGPGRWERIFDAQVATPPIVRWAAVPWEWDGLSEAARKLKRTDITLPPILPFQKGETARLPEAVDAIEKKRRKRFQGWVDTRTWRHYQAARWTFLQTHPGYLLGQRGFDYALHHHRLLAVLDARKRLGDVRSERDEPGEKCSLCGARQALTNHLGEGGAERLRDHARRLWARIDPEGLGSERLCGPCAVRRHLTDSGDAIRENWQHTLHASEIPQAGGNPRHAVPFPSTGLVAGQQWLEKLCDLHRRRPGLQRAVKDFNRAFQKSRIAPTQFAGALPALRRRLQRGLHRDLVQLLRADVQYLDPAAWDRLAAASGQAAGSHPARGPAEAIGKILGPMPTHLAVITLDGDQMGRLLLGAPDRIRARWRDVLHPEAVAAIQRDPKRGDAPDWKIAWRATLEARRLMGPSLHAFVSRALRHFSNRVLPWVVEREFHGRLIYAGGDDALLLCPADEALPLLQRLDALFTAAWVLDRHPDASTWVREEPDEPLYAVGSREARARFQVIGLDGDDTTSATARVPDDHRGARLFPMLGPHSSFSAGVSIGHFKTSLRLLRAHAGEQRDRAKVLGGRRVGVTWFTRSGPKVHAVLPLDDVPGGVGHVRELTARFSRGAIPGRLPYKLRETAAIARCAIDGRGPPGDGSEAASPDTATRVVTGLVQRALEGGGTDAARIARAWLDRLSAGDRGGARQADAPPAVVEPADQEGLGFLLLARALAGLDKEGE